MMTEKEILKKIKIVIQRAAPGAEVILFGSRARGDAKKLSDWDLLILLNSLEVPFKIETTLMDELYELEIDTGQIISPLLYTKKDWNEKYKISPLFENIQKEGVHI